MCIRDSLYKALRMGNIETVLASAIAAVFFAAFIVAGTMWYGSAATPVELFGPTRYQWDQSYFKTEINRRVQTAMDDGASQNCFDISHTKRFIEALGRSSRDVKNASNDANDACSNVVSNDSTGVEGIKSFRPPSWLNSFEVACHAVGI